MYFIYLRTKRKRIMFPDKNPNEEMPKTYPTDMDSRIPCSSTVYVLNNL